MSLTVVHSDVLIWWIIKQSFPEGKLYNFFFSYPHALPSSYCNYLKLCPREMGIGVTYKSFMAHTSPINCLMSTSHSRELRSQSYSTCPWSSRLLLTLILLALFPKFWHTAWLLRTLFLWLWLSKQQSLGKFALVQDYVNYRQIITSLKRAEINYLFDEMVAEWENNDLTKINK